MQFFIFILVGYGTQTPSSITGKAIGGFCAIVGVFILTLPVPIVVNSFASYYKNRLWRNEVSIVCISSKLRYQMQLELCRSVILILIIEQKMFEIQLEYGDYDYRISTKLLEIYFSYLSANGNNSKSVFVEMVVWYQRHIL